ncbi:phage head-tail adapter protein [Staphylococcus auricularis]|uniref:phage head-tail adapter protein n=1 Tax=Staphylococcus auricularis TaxID=29379 RepID=UPI00242F94CB|nr:phage head-tail adapter protein [Staphylococcus auricularis]
MNKNKWITGGDMRTPVIFYVVKPYDDPEPGEKIEEVYYKCFADVHPPSVKDLDMTDHEASITLETYFPLGYDITDDMYFEIDLPNYKNQYFNIRNIESDINHMKTVKLIGAHKS